MLVEGFALQQNNQQLVLSTLGEQALSTQPGAIDDTSQTSFAESPPHFLTPIRDPHLSNHPVGPPYQLEPPSPSLAPDTEMSQQRKKDSLLIVLLLILHHRHAPFNVWTTEMMTPSLRLLIQ